jgi:hypothetical protein
MMGANLEKRVQALEEAVACLRNELRGGVDPRRAWWRETVGRFKDDPVFEEIVRLGKQYRESLRPKRKKRRT